MSTAPAPSPSVTMIDPSGITRSIPANGVAQAPSNWKPATKMIDPQGTPRWIPTEATDQAKTAGYVLHPDSMQRPLPTKSDDTSENGNFGTGALPKGYTGDPNKYGQLATNDEVNARAAATNANLTPEQRKALGISDHLQNTAGNVMLAAGAVGNAAVAAPAAAPVINTAARAAAPIVGKQAAKYVASAVVGGSFELGRELIEHWIKGFFK